MISAVQNADQPIDLVSFQARLEEILREKLLPPSEFKNPGMKVIHDPLWGSCLYYPWEIALLDTPMCQRLRHIHQLGTAFLTYPSAIHNRFSHTLGVITLAGRLIDKLREKSQISPDSVPVEISKRDVYTVRLAGLLHDVGHCFFSHASEKVLSPVVAKAIAECSIGNPKPHEFFSYLFATNHYFKKYWDSNVIPIFEDISDIPSLDEIAKMIVKIPFSPERRFLQEIISGAYDVDKLEYLYRDSRMAGLQISYDIERYFYKIRVAQTATGCRLVMDHGGISAIEQIIFSKMMLFSFVYHHQKVLASDMIIFDLVWELIANENERINIKHPLDFLLYTDADILSSNNQDLGKKYQILSDRIKTRDLPKRCFVINREFVIGLNSDDTVKEKWRKLLEDLRGLPEESMKIRQNIVERIKACEGCEEFKIDDIFINMPKAPKMDEAASAPVVDATGNIKPMSEYFMIEGWKTTYDLKKLKGYFYVTEKYKRTASCVIEQYLEEEYGIKFNENSKIEAKLK
ncbi:MAG: HD domain-containing protein [Desulfobacterales bacterium]